MSAITFMIHGSNMESANDFVTGLVEGITSRFPTNLAFLTGGTPNLNLALERHYQNGHKNIRIFPLFLSPGKHVLTDIPAMAKDFTDRHPDCRIDIEDFIGGHPEFVTLLKNWINEK